jgi:hypothetical protein
MKLLHLLPGILLSGHLHSQILLLGHPKTEIEKKLSADPGTGVTSYDSTISYNLPAGNQGYITIICHFSTEEKCSMLSFTSVDSLAYRDYFSSVIKDQKYRWRKINGNQYVSKFSKRLLLETDPDKSKRSFRILPAQWTRKTYKLIDSY